MAIAYCLTPALNILWRETLFLRSFACRNFVLLFAMIMFVQDLSQLINLFFFSIVANFENANFFLGISGVYCIQNSHGLFR